MAAQQHKERGNALYAQGNYDEAIAAFTAAIEAADKGEKDLLKTTFSNRSAAHLQLKNVEAALADATKCTELDPQWAKGHVRKGDALQVLDAPPVLRVVGHITLSPSLHQHQTPADS